MLGATKFAEVKDRVQPVLPEEAQHQQPVVVDCNTISATIKAESAGSAFFIEIAPKSFGDFEVL